MTNALIDEALTRVVTQTLKQMSGLDAVATREVEIRHETTIWSWVKVVDPKPGMVVVGMHSDLAAQLASICLDEGQDHQLTHGEVCDAQAEFTNLIAARLANALFISTGMVTLGIPRTGPGVPDIRNGAWVARHLGVDSIWMAVFISGEALTSPNTTVHLHAVSTLPMADKSILSVDDSSEKNFVPIQGSPKIVQDAGPKYIGNYRIIDQLGAGGMGIVYKAHHDSLKRMIALKVMRPDLARDQTFINRFLREGRAAANVDHPNVVPVYDAGFADGHLYQAMRYVPGGDLASLLHRSGTLPEDHALMIVLSCIAGLQAISDAGMIHRDLKPANILLEANGVPRLADLGLVRMVSATELSLPGSPQGTPHYMSPEQARASRDLDIRSDIYALGVTLYCMLCGQTPFSGDSPYDVVANVLYQLNPDPRSVQPGISAGAAALVMKAMAKLPEERFQTLREFQMAVNAVPPCPRQNGLTTGSGKIRQPSPNNFWMRKLFGTTSRNIDGDAVTTQL